LKKARNVADSFNLPEAFDGLLDILASTCEEAPQARSN